jgi:hypothetical protein
MLAAASGVQVLWSVRDRAHTADKKLWNSARCARGQVSALPPGQQESVRPSKRTTDERMVVDGLQPGDATFPAQPVLLFTIDRGHQFGRDLHR